MAESAEWFRYGALHLALQDIDWENDTFKYAVVDALPALDTTEFWDPSDDGSTGPIADEVTGTGWAAGGVTLTTVAPALDANSDPTPDYIVFDAADISEDPVTFTGATYGVIYRVGTGGTDDYVVALHNLDGAKSPSAGTFSVTWSADGVMRNRMEPAA